MKCEMWDKTGMNTIISSHGMPRVRDKLRIVIGKRPFHYRVLEICWSVKEVAINDHQTLIPIPSVEVEIIKDD